MATEVGTIASVEDMLARAKAAAATKGSTAGLSRVQQMLAGTETTDTVTLSPVAKLLQSSSTAAKKTSYQDEDWFIKARVAQLKGDIALYSTLPGLDPSGAMMESLTQEVNALVTSQQKKLKAATAESDKKQAELDRIEKEKADAPMSADEMLKGAKNRVDGVAPVTTVSTAVQAMLDKVKGSVVNKTA